MLYIRTSEAYPLSLQLPHIISFSTFWDPTSNGFCYLPEPNELELSRLPNISLFFNIFSLFLKIMSSNSFISFLLLRLFVTLCHDFFVGRQRNGSKYPAVNFFFSWQYYEFLRSHVFSCLAHGGYTAHYCSNLFFPQQFNQLCTRN